MNKMSLYAFADEACPNIDGQISALLRNRLDGLEIRGVNGKNISGVTVGEAKEIKHKLDNSGLSVFSVGSPIGKIGINDSLQPHLDSFKHLLELCHVLGAENIRIFSFYVDGNAEQYADTVLERLNRMASEAEGSGVTLCHENEKGIFGDIPQRCLMIHENIPSVKAVFDPANFIQCGINTLDAYEILKKHIKYMHIKDALPNGTIVPAGCGIGNIQSIVSDMISSGRSSFTLEPHLTVFKGLAELERSGEESKINAFRYPDSDTAFDAAVSAFNKTTGRRSQ